MFATMFDGQAYNITDETEKHIISPLTFSSEWPTITRFVFMLFCVTFGCIMNSFFLSSFFVENSLKRIGLVFLALVGLSDLIITTCIMPVSTVILLSGQGDTVSVCKGLQWLSLTSTYCYSLFFMLAAADNYYMYCRSRQEYEVFLSMGIAVIATSVYILSALLAAAGVYWGLDYDYCERKHFGNFYFRIITLVLFHAVPGLITMICMIASSIRIRRRARQKVAYRRSLMYECDNAMNSTNIFAYLLYVVGWTPYLIIIYEFPGTSDKKYYSAVLIGLLRSIITSFVYGTVHKSFRRAFGKLFNYCFCKNALSTNFAGRHRQRAHRMVDLRVHIMHQVISNSPQRRGVVIHETRDL